MARWVWACAFACGALVASAAMWGFTVDDALISIRYARHLAMGVGYRFNVDGPSTDGVTPLPWPFVLVALSHGSPWTVLGRVKVLDMVFHASAAGLLGTCKAPWWARAMTLVLLALCLPFAAYGASGMDTPLATLLATVGVVHGDRESRSSAPIFAGLAAAIRPELLPWAAAVSCGLALGRRAPARVVLSSVVASAGPFVVCAAVRRVMFGHFEPLAVWAKPSDLTHGLVYVVAALLACGVPVVLVAPFALRKGSAKARAVTLAFLVHAVAVACAGGDSMAYARLFVPVVPSVLLVHLQTASVARVSMFWLRSVCALGLELYVAVSAAPHGRHVMDDRAALIARAEPALRGAHHIAAVDVGWVSASTEADIIDLAGLTDPEFAGLPGGHTSKRVSGTMLLDRDVDTVLLWATRLPDRWGHAVAARLASDPVVTTHYVRAAELPLGDTGAGYVLLERAP
jgi:hypothetical protein